MEYLRLIKNKYTLLIAIALCLLLVLSGCKSEELKAMEKSASVLKLTTGSEITRWQDDKGTTLGKPSYPTLRIEYMPINGFELEDVQDEIITIMKRNNWTSKGVSAETGSHRASLRKEDFTIEAVVSIGRERNIVAVQFTTLPHK